MKSIKMLGTVPAAAVSLCFCLSGQLAAAQENPPGDYRSNASYPGRWDLTIRTPTQERSAWLELTQNKGELEGLLIGWWGHATPTQIKSKDGQIEFAVPKDEGFPEGTVFHGRLAGGGLAGTVTTLNGASWQWSGRRAPSLARKGSPTWGKPMPLFDGNDLSGWTFADPTQAGAWGVEDGTLIKHGRGSEIVTTSRFQDFKLHIEFNCGPMANSGVYLRGRYEVQIETNAAQESENRRTGAVYGFIAPQPALPRTPDIWQSYDITLVGRTVTVIHNGHTIINEQEIPGPTGGALDSSEDSPGPIYLQGTEDGRVTFRNIIITPAQ